MTTTPGDHGSTTQPYPRYQHEQIEWLDLMHRQHTVHGLLSCDVTEARRKIREYRAATGTGLSLTAFVVACFAQAIAADRQVHAYRRGRQTLVLFDDVDVTVLVESDVEGARIPVPHIVRAADRMSVAAIHDEIRAAQRDPVPYAGGRRLLPLWLLVPRFLRVWFWSMVLAEPRRRKRLTGTAVVTSVGMFGRAMAWGIPITDHTVALTVGGIERRLSVVRADDRTVSAGEAAPTIDGLGATERIAVREHLALTLSFDHDVVDGAPASRFAARLKALIETGHGIGTVGPTDGPSVSHRS